MANFNSSILTEKGIELITRAQAGLTNIQFTKIQTGDGQYDVTEDISKKISLKSMKQEFGISKKSIINQNTVYLESIVSNEALNAGYYVKEFGLFAKDQNEEEILYSIATAVEKQCDYLPAYNDLSPSTITIESYVTVSNAENVTIEAGHGAVASADALEKVAESIGNIGALLTEDKTNIVNAINELKNIALNNPAELKKAVDALNAAIDLAYENGNAYTDVKIAGLINGAPEILDTLKEVADAIANNKSIVDALNDAIGTKANKAELDTHTSNETVHIAASERAKWNGKQDKITVDATLSATSTNPIQNKAVKTALTEQETKITELNGSLNTFTDSGKVEQLYVGADGKPYIKYKVGADTVDLKLDDTYVPTFICGFYTANISYMTMVVDVEGYNTLKYKAKSTGIGRTYHEGAYVGIPSVDTEYIFDVSNLKSFSMEFQACNPAVSTISVHDVVRL